MSAYPHDHDGQQSPPVEKTDTSVCVMNPIDTQKTAEDRRPVFGTKVNVISCTEVSAWIRPIARPDRQRRAEDRGRDRDGDPKPLVECVEEDEIVHQTGIRSNS